MSADVEQAVEMVDGAARALVVATVGERGWSHAGTILLLAAVYAYKAAGGARADRAELLRLVGRLFDETVDRRLT